MSDLVAVNGSAAKRAYLDGSYPASKVLEVEALRYLYLAEYSFAAPKLPRPAGAPLSVLAMGDYLSDNTQLQMRLLEQAAALLPKNTIFVVKPHPNCPVNLVDYPGLNMTVTMEPLSILLAKCDVAYSSAITSAAVDAYCVGVRVISVLDPKKLNLSPLLDCAQAVFVSTPDELASALVLDFTSFVPAAGAVDFFCLDAKLPRWRNLLDTGNSSKILDSSLMRNKY
jgi:surface carbohydrate biosynthesis protein (TIGR04326 family)